MPQWDLLDLLADAAAEEPTFTLRRNAEVTDLLHDGDRVAGVRFTDRTDGTVHELRASLTVACDGRGSAVRAAAGLRPAGSACRWTCGGSGCRGTTATRPGSSAACPAGG